MLRVPPGLLALRVLILGGTAEARALAVALDGRAVVLTSLAGAVEAPLLPPGEVRIGGFGGADGLADLVGSWRPDVVVDATHPFAAEITAHAATAVVSVPLLVVRRPAWVAEPADRWTSYGSIADCAAAVRDLPAGVVFLTTGRRDVALFAADDVHDYLVRSVTTPPDPLPPRTTLLLDRGPYTIPGELALMAAHRVDVLVTKNSGGEMTSAKLTASRQLALPVLMVERPALPPGLDVLPDVESVLARLDP
ncbi:cobalt-precorrin-6A reductase [Acidothermaceae bacterium B102]|nr:cobalt-precorrin-6A reductase [Acidothermaceae bacterium B102]